MSKLSDFGGGAEEPAPEDQVKIDLSQWFSSAGATVYWEKRPSYGHQVFRTSGTDKPDLLVVGDWRTFAIEVKPGADGAGIHDGIVQTHRYWEDFVVRDETYRLDDGVVEPDAFLLATQHAPDGRLFYRHGTRDTVRDRHVKDRFPQFDPPIQWLPDWEFTNTESATRILWRFAKRSRPETAPPAGIGVMLSDRLDGSQPHQLTPDDPDPFDRAPLPEPKALYRTFNGSGNGIDVHQWRSVE